MKLEDVKKLFEEGEIGYLLSKDGVFLSKLTIECAYSKGFPAAILIPTSDYLYPCNDERYSNPTILGIAEMETTTTRRAFIIIIDVEALLSLPPCPGYQKLRPIIDLQKSGWVNPMGDSITRGVTVTSLTNMIMSIPERYRKSKNITFVPIDGYGDRLKDEICSIEEMSNNPDYYKVFFNWIVDEIIPVANNGIEITIHNPNTTNEKEEE